MRQVSLLLGAGAAVLALLALLNISAPQQSELEQRRTEGQRGRHAQDPLLARAVAKLKAHRQAQLSQLHDAHPWPFKPTKFGPLRRKEWQSSRYQALALWNAAERSIETCFSAASTIFPEASDRNCRDVDQTMSMLQECMRHQRDGMQGLADGKNGAWSALPELVELTNALGDDDRKMVDDKIAKSSVLYTLARVEALHAQCHGRTPGAAASPKDGLREDGDKVNMMDKVFTAVRNHGGVLPEDTSNTAGNPWPQYMVYRKPLYTWPRNWNSVRRGTRRSYWDYFDWM